MYPSDLTGAQWAKLELLLKAPGGNRHAGGRPRKHALRRVVDALLYVVKTGCQWRQLPADFPPWLSVHQQFRAWRDDGTWERVTRTLREHALTGSFTLDVYGGKPEWGRNLEAARLAGAEIEKAVQQAITKRQEQQEQCSPETSFGLEEEKPRILAA